MKINVKKIEDPNIRVPINIEEHRIESIKAEFVECKTTPKSCEVEELEMWNDLED